MDFIRENIKNASRILGMAKLSVQEEFRGTKLGLGWELIRVIVFFTVYILFRLFIRGGGKPVEAVLSIASVILPFQFVTAVINQTPKIYRKRRVLVTTVNFPSSIIPTFDILAKLIIHCIAIAIIMIVFIILDIVLVVDRALVSWNYLSLIYYYGALCVLLLSIMMTLSLICSVSLDVYKFWQVITKIFIYINPIFWTVDDIVSRATKFNETLGTVVNVVIRSNPFVYIFEGVRNCMCNGQWIEISWHALYFWVLTILLFCLGNKFQKKIGKMLPDIL